MLKYVYRQPQKAEFLSSLASHLAGQAPIVEFDIETFNRQGLTGLDPHTSEIRTMQFNMGGTRYVVDNELWRCGAVEDMLASPHILKLIHNAKFEKLMCRGILGWEINNVWCTMLADQVLNNGRYDRFGLASVVERRCGVVMDKTEQKSDWGVDQLSKSQIIYAGVDVKYLTQIYKQQVREAEESDLRHVIDFEHKVLDVVVNMQLEGMVLDSEYIKSLRGETEQALDKLLSDIQRILPPVPLTKSDAAKKKMREQYPDGVKPPTSTGDFKRAFALAGIKVPTKYDKTTKTNKQSLSAGTYHLIDHEVGPLLAEHAKVKKILTTYINKMPAWVHPITGKVHGDFKQVGTTTGRMSMAEPNLQNIPARSAIGKKIRKGFIAPDGYEYVKVDYSQLELRLAAIIFGIRKMIKAYSEGIDVHMMTAATVTKKPMSDVTKDERSLAKGVNFGTIYGQFAKGLKEYLWTVFGIEVELSDAEYFIDAFYTTWPEVPEYHQRIKERTKNAVLRQREYVASTLAGRKKFWGMQEQADGSWKHKIPLNTKVTDFGEYSWTNCNDIINMPVQGSGGDGMKLAQIRLDRYLKTKKSKMVLQVHDELGFYVHKSETEKVLPKIIQIMVESMEHIVQHKIKIEVEASIGPSWGELKPVDSKYYGAHTHG